ncbi:DUF1036 domain-containing protein [Desulfovibrio sp. OttesenSCG-928-C14]|nr:DUF1036 domain-containing protein [Desulfovibrio sp. OttesenSCG-928-C14]
MPLLFGGIQPMKRTILPAILFVYLFALPLQALAVELNIRNEEQSSARVALAYLQGDWFVVEGWFRLEPEQVETITLHDVKETDVYIFVEFADPQVHQFIANPWKAECLVHDGDFRYSLKSVGGKPTPDSPDMRKAPFQNIGMFYREESGKLWFSLTAAAG